MSIFAVALNIHDHNTYDGDVHIQIERHNRKRHNLNPTNPHDPIPSKKFFKYSILFLFSKIYLEISIIINGEVFSIKFVAPFNTFISFPSTSSLIIVKKSLEFILFIKVSIFIVCTLLTEYE